MNFAFALIPSMFVRFFPQQDIWGTQIHYESIDQLCHLSQPAAGNNFMVCGYRCKVSLTGNVVWLSALSTAAELDNTHYAAPATTKDNSSCSA